MDIKPDVFEVVTQNMIHGPWVYSTTIHHACLMENVRNDIRKI